MVLSIELSFQFLYKCLNMKTALENIGVQKTIREKALLKAGQE
jgi:hypothetical protein